MRSIFLIQLTFAAITVLSASTTNGQESSPSTIVALDQATANLLSPHLPKLAVIVVSEDEPFGRLNQRALSMLDAEYVVFRSDQISLSSQLFRERLINHGVRGVDLTAHFWSSEPEGQTDLDAKLRNLPPRIAQLLSVNALEVAERVALLDASP